MSPDVCPATHAGMLMTPLRRLFHKPEKIFAGLVSDGQTAIDLGCGPGYFSIGLAKMVGDSGRVISVDLQPEMLDMVKANAAKHNLQSRIRAHQCKADSLDLNEKADFVLAFWMVHEVPDKDGLLRQVTALLKPGAKFMMVEPKMHVGKKDWEKTVEIAKAVGFMHFKEIKVSISRALIFTL